MRRKKTDQFAEDKRWVFVSIVLFFNKETTIVSLGYNNNKQTKNIEKQTTTKQQQQTNGACESGMQQSFYLGKITTHIRA